MKAITKWIDRHSDSPTVMISNADHECGGLTVGDNYMWLPSALTESKASSDSISKQWASYTGPNPDTYLLELFKKYGVQTPTPEQLSAATAAKATPSVSNFIFAKALSDLILVNFSTLGHTAVDVSLFGYGPGHEEFSGNHDNTEVAGFVARKLDLDLGKITRKLKKEKKWIEERVKAPKGQKVKRSHSHHHH